MILDYSAHDSWAFCPGMWWEKYISRRRRKWPKAQRDDALCLGSLVHEGLRVWQESHTVEIPQQVQEEMTPSRECLNLANELVFGYAQRYPEERWPLILCEEPVTFPLRGEEISVCESCLASWGYKVECPMCGEPTVRKSRDILTGLAKIDSYFLVEEETEVEMGVEGLTFTLTPGWWIHEYKTKSPYVPLPIYMQAWEMNLQASYQLTALRHKMRDSPHKVQGILINVLEKPRRHIPKRKCRACEETYEFATWLPTGTGEYACPACGNRQVLTALKEAQPQLPCAFYRIMVTRSLEELAADREIMLMVGERMIHMEEHGLHSEPWTKKNCVDTFSKRACDYFSPHKYGHSTSGSDIYEHVPDYRGLIQIDPT